MHGNNEGFLEICKQWDLFFKQCLDKAIARKRFNISDEANFYLLEILRQAATENPHSVCLGEKYLSAKDRDEYRTVGDLSLMTTGIWWQRMLSRSSDPDYYFNIGKNSYKKVSREDKDMSYLFEELAENFQKLSNLLAETTLLLFSADASNLDILRIYRRWEETRNVFLAEILRSFGINVPGKTILH